MSVVARQTRRRWTVVAAGAALLLAVPTLLPYAAQLTDRKLADRASATSLLERALGTPVPHTGLAETRGALGLPDLPRLAGVADVLGSTTRTRVWWSSATDWRVDTLSATGEQGAYVDGAHVVVWDYERGELTQVAHTEGARLPRIDDLLPPQAARLALQGVGSGDETRLLGTRRVAGRSASGLSVEPGDPRTTVRRIEVWVDDASGLPLELRLDGLDGSAALISRFLDLEVGEPATTVLTPPAPGPGVEYESDGPDLASLADTESPWVLPQQLQGLPSSRSADGGVVAYGTGVARFVVVPLPDRLAQRVLSAARTAGAVELDLVGGQGALVGTPLVNAVAVRDYDARHAYLIAGPVTPALLTEAADELLADAPPGRRR